MADSQASPTARFTKWVEDQLQVLPPGSFLPFDRELAAAWGLSPRTVWSVLKGFRDRGQLVRVRGKGTMIPGPAAADRTPRQRLDAAEALAAAIAESIAGGTFRSGEPLPPVKYLCRQFRVGATTVSAAFRSLTRRRFVTRIGKRYWAGDLGEQLSGRPARQVYFMLWRSDAFRSVFAHPTQGETFYRMERELLKYGFLLRFENTLRFPDLVGSWQSGHAPPHALLLLGMSQRRWDTVRSHLDRLKYATGIVPRLVVDSPAPLEHLPRETACYTMGAVFTALCRRLARFAATHRFRRVILYFDEAERERTFFTACMKIRAELGNAAPGCEFFTYVKLLNGSADTEVFLARFRTRRRGHIESVLSKYGPTSVDVLTRETRVVRDFKPVWRRGRPGDLWVTMSAAHAAEALAVATDKGLRVPRDVSIISMCDDPALCHLGISCCVRDRGHAGYALAHALIGNMPVEKTTRGFIRLRVQLLERRTTP